MRIRITKKRIILIILLIFAVIFMFNLLRNNAEAETSDAEVKENLKVISSFDFSKVPKVEDKVQAANQEYPITPVESSSGISKAKYRKIFSKCMIIGDSLTDGLLTYGFLGEEQVSCEIGASVMKGRKIFTKAAKSYPKAAFFAFGMNDLGNYQGNAENFIRDYRALLKEFSKTSPKSKLYINSISMPSQKAQKNNKWLKKYKKFNSALRAMCKEDGLTYIDNTYILEENPDFYGSDGIHVSTRYYPLWLKNMILEAGL